MYGLVGDVGTRREALKNWIFPVDWLEYGKEEIKLGIKYPWCGGKGYVSRGAIHVGWLA